jgi:hypothetical protein
MYNRPTFLTCLMKSQYAVDNVVSKFFDFCSLQYGSIEALQASAFYMHIV